METALTVLLWLGVALCGLALIGILILFVFMVIAAIAEVRK